jgi:uncharacterized protein (TIGR00725 family)
MRTFRLDRKGRSLGDDLGRVFDPVGRRWTERGPSSVVVAAGEAVDAMEAATWLQRESGHPLRVPVGVIGPRDGGDAQLAAALAVGELLAQCGFTVMCGGRQGVMDAVCEGVARNGGVSIGLLPDADPALANRHVGVVLATGIGEARNALIARAAFCLVAIGNSYGTLSEVALGRQFGKTVIGLAGAADVEGVEHVATPLDAVHRVAALALGVDA